MYTDRPRTHVTVGGRCANNPSGARKNPHIIATYLLLHTEVPRIHALRAHVHDTNTYARARRHEEARRQTHCASLHTKQETVCVYVRVYAQHAQAEIDCRKGVDASVIATYTHSVHQKSTRAHITKKVTAVS